MWTCLVHSPRVIISGEKRHHGLNIVDRTFERKGSLIEMKGMKLVLFCGTAALIILGAFAAESYSFLPRDFGGGQGSPANQLVGSTGSPSPFVASTTGTATTKTTYSSFMMTGTSGSEWPWRCYYYSVQAVPIEAAIDAMRRPPSNVKVFQGNDTILFAGTQNIAILVLSMGGDRARNLTGMQLPGYAADNVFVIYGLIDPTLVVPRGSDVRIVMVNLDEDAYHNVVLTSLAPPYSSMPMQGMMWTNGTSWYPGMMGGGMMGGRSGSIFAMMTPTLPPADYGRGQASYYATSFSLDLASGTYWYLCTYPGHAQMGMYGKLVLGA